MEGKATLDSKQFISKMNEFKMLISAAAEGLPPREFKPLTVKPHPRQAEMDAYRQIPSGYA